MVEEIYDEVVAINVYVLDDDNSARNGLCRLLKAAGFKAISFPDVSSFINVLGPNSFGVLVTDLRMPGLSVKELVKELNYRELKIDIIVVTGDDTIQSKKIAKDIGAVGFFRKPVDGTALIDSIKWSVKMKSEK